MKKLLFSLLFVMSTLPGASTANESEKDYSMCKVAGYYEGNGDRFLYEMAMRVVEKNRLNAYSDCSLAIKNGKEIGMKFSKPGRLKNEEESAVIDEATHFSNLVYDAILSRIKFD